MIQAYPDTINLAPKPASVASDSRATMLQLLSTASEISCRRYLTSDCPLARQGELEKKWMFDEAMEQLTCVGEITPAYMSSKLGLVVRRAYDVFCSDMVERDSAFYDASYGTEEIGYQLFVTTPQ